jgi:hypothetical protein
MYNQRSEFGVKHADQIACSPERAISAISA